MGERSKTEDLNFVLSQKAAPFQSWVRQNAKQCVDHLENIHQSFIETSAEIETTQKIQGNFKSWIEDVLKNYNYHHSHEMDELKVEKLQNEYNEQYRHEIDQLKSELMAAEIEKKNNELQHQVRLNELEKLRAQQELCHLNQTSQLQLDIEQAKQEETSGNDQIQKLQDQYEHEISVFLKQYTTASSAIKGNSAQVAYSQLFSETFPTADIEETNSTPRSCDIKMTIDSIKTPIFIEIKNYSTTVPSLEVDKFKRDVNEKAGHGIMIAQSTGIATKVDQQIEITNGTIQVFLCNNKLNSDAIKIAVESIRTLSQHIRTELRAQGSEDSETKTLSNEIVYKIVEELNNIAHVNTRIKENLKATINFINVEHVANIQKLLEGENIDIQQKKKTILRLATIDRRDVIEDYDVTFEQAQFLVEDGTDRQVMNRVILQCQKIREQTAFNDGVSDMTGTWTLYVSKPLLQPSDRIEWDIIKEFQDEFDFFAYLDEMLEEINGY